MKRLLWAGLLLSLPACTNLIFQPTDARYARPEQYGLAADELQLENGPIRLHGLRLHAQGERKGTVLFLHGNGQNISAYLGVVSWLPKHGYEVLMFDYRGYGQSTGVPEIDGVIDDVQKMLAWSSDESARRHQRLIVMGHSLGGSLAIYAVARFPNKARLAGLISVDAFGDYRQVTRDTLARLWITRIFKWPLSLTVSNEYRPLDVVGDISPLPVYILHSTDDALVPFAHAEALFGAARQPKDLVRLKGRHNELFYDADNRKLILTILDKLSRGSAAMGP